MKPLRFSYDGFGINLKSAEYSPRIATFVGRQDEFGNLMAAAPEMLEALEAVYELFQEGEIVFKGKTLQVSKIRKAIERARGE